MEEGLFLDGVALDAADITPGHKQGSALVVANLANPRLAIWDLPAMPAGKTQTCLEATKLNSIQDVCARRILGTLLSAWRWPLCPALHTPETAGNALTHHAIAARAWS